MICLKGCAWSAQAGPSPPSCLLFEVSVWHFRCLVMPIARNLEFITQILGPRCSDMGQKWGQASPKLVAALAGLSESEQTCSVPFQSFIPGLAEGSRVWSLAAEMYLVGNVLSVAPWTRAGQSQDICLHPKQEVHPGGLPSRKLQRPLAICP